MRSSEIIDRHRSRLAAALREISISGVYASQQAWDDRNTFECELAHAERRLSRQSAVRAGLWSWIAPRGRLAGGLL